MTRPPAEPSPVPDAPPGPGPTVGELSEAELLARVLPLLLRPAPRPGADLVLLGPGDDGFSSSSGSRSAAGERIAGPCTLRRRERRRERRFGGAETQRYSGTGRVDQADP